VIVVLMGVAGAGKTTVGRLLADALGWEFADGDDYHSAANIEKMRSGIPLTDADREPWLKSLRDLVLTWIEFKKNAVLACSALKQSYRDYLQVNSEVHFVYLRASEQALHERLRARHGHFMTDKMLASQLATLQEPEHAIVIDGDRAPQEIVAEIRRTLQQFGPMPAV
jgi:gluconokinase